MTVNKLHKLLGDLITKGHGRKTVCVAKTTFTHNCESDGVTILDVEGFGIRTINIADGDGAIGTNKDGTERCKSVLILAGSGGCNSKGELVDY